MKHRVGLTASAAERSVKLGPIKEKKTISPRVQKTIRNYNAAYLILN